MDAAAAQDEFGEPVVDVGGAFDGRAAVPDDLVGPLQAGEGRAGLGEQVRRVDGGRREGGEGAEQGDLLAFEDAGTPVRGEEHADDVMAEHQGYAEDGDEALVVHARVDGARVLEAGVLEVVLGDVGAGGLGDQAAEPLPHAQPQLLEAGRDRTLGDAHVRVAARRVVEAEVGHVGAEQRAGPLHDRAEDGVQVAQSGEVVGRLEQRGQLGLPPAPALQLGAHAQGEALGLFQRLDPPGRARLRAGAQHRLLVGLGRGAPGQQLQERRLDGGGRRARGSAGRRSGIMGEALVGLHVIAGHGHRIPHRTAGPAALWKTRDAGAGALSVRRAAVGLSARSSLRPGRVRCR